MSKQTNRIKNWDEKEKWGRKRRERAKRISV